MPGITGQQETDERQRKAELESYAHRRMDQAVADALAAVQQEAPQLPPDQREAIVQYLSQVPAAIRRSLRRPADDIGTTVPAGRVPRSANDMLSFLPLRLPRFKPGDRPWEHSDLELVELLGHGGFGEVWKARHLERPKQPPVALKFCLDAGAARSLERERDLLDHVTSIGKHDGIVQLLYTHLWANPPCLEYECVEGGDLTGILIELHANGKPAPVEVAEMILNLARIVAFAHRQDPAIVHRDLKPANILVRRREDKLAFKIADFGIGGLAAKESIRKLNTGQTRASDRQLETAHGAYTPLYASPEQIRGDKPDPRDDVHALGIIWFQLQTGQPALMNLPSHWREDLKDAKVPGPLLDLLATCIDKQAHRPRDAGELVNRLAGFFNSVSVDASTTAVAPAAGRGSPPPQWTESATALPAKYKIPQVDIDMRLIPAGRFMMGSPVGEEGRGNDETLHDVVLTTPFYLAVHPVTRGQFRRFAESQHYYTEAERDGWANAWDGEFYKDYFHWRKPGFNQNDKHPVVCVSHNDAVAYCEWLSRLTGETYGLASEAQWEYACRGVPALRDVEITTDPYHFGKAITPKHANFADSGIRGTTKVGCYPPNGFGLCDMHGNVWEWCADWDREYSTSESDTSELQSPPRGLRRTVSWLGNLIGLFARAPGPSTDFRRVARGGCWGGPGKCCRAASRDGSAPWDRSNVLGFRVSRVPSVT